MMGDGKQRKGASPFSDTRHRIIEAAGEIFADLGYRHTTIRVVSQRAGVNIAAINYHFGGKKNLYLAILDYWRMKAFEKYPFDLSDVATGSPRERLRTFVRILLLRVLDEGEGSLFARLMAQEFIQPTGSLDVIVEEVMRPLFAFLSATVRQLLNDRSPEQTVILCCASVVGQVFQFYLGRHVMRRLLNREKLSGEEIEAVADHIARFSIYAIEAIAAENRGESR
jgi:TetR/AcrR family transcriptional regulator, regulator of cefoperazone and chloramphenicol sensitivity